MIPNRKPVRKPVPDRSQDVMNSIRDIPRVDDIGDLDKEKEKASQQDEQDPLSLPRLDNDTEKEEPLSLPQLDSNTEKENPQATVGPIPRVDDVPAKEQAPQAGSGLEVAAAKPNVTVYERPSPPTTNSYRPAYRSLFENDTSYTASTSSYRPRSPPKPTRVPTPPATSIYSDSRYQGTRTPPTSYNRIPAVEVPRFVERERRTGCCWVLYAILTIAISLMVLVGGYSTKTRYFPLAVIPNLSDQVSTDLHARFIWGYSGFCYVLDHGESYGDHLCRHKFVQDLTPYYPGMWGYSEGDGYYNNNSYQLLEAHGYKSPKIRQRIFKASAALLIVSVIMLICSLFLIGDDTEAEGLFTVLVITIWLIPYFIMVHMAVVSFLIEAKAGIASANLQDVNLWGLSGSGGKYVPWGLVLVDINIVLTVLLWLWYGCKFCCC